MVMATRLGHNHEEGGGGKRPGAHYITNQPHPFLDLTGNLVEVSFAELEADAVGTLRSIYDRLGLAGFDRVEPDVQHYCSTLADFKKNDLERWESWVVGVPVAVCMAGQLGQTRFP